MVGDYNSRPIPVAERAPCKVVIPVMPVNPSRSPSPCWNPVPSPRGSPVPSSIPGCAPTPGMGRNPSPTDNGIPHPTSKGVGPPGRIPYCRDPDITKGCLIGPPPVIGQFGFVFVKFVREVTFGHIAGLEFITGTAPIGKAVIIFGVVITGLRTKSTIRGKEAFVFLNYNGSLLPSSFQHSFIHQHFSLDIFSDYKTVKTFF